MRPAHGLGVRRHRAPALRTNPNPNPNPDPDPDPDLNPNPDPGQVRLLNGSGAPLGMEWAHAEWDTMPPKLLNSTDERFITWMRTSPFAVRKP